MRNYFEKQNYLEVDTPVLVKNPGNELYLRYFQTKYFDPNRKMEAPFFLRSSPELHMKRLLARGADRIFQIGPVMRNGGEWADWHRPEFVMLEFYEKGISYEGFMTRCEDLIQTCARAFAEDSNIAKKIASSKPQRIRVGEAFKRFANVTLESLVAQPDFETRFFKTMLDHVEKNLSGLWTVFDYPASMAALARVEGGVAKRFELYLDGVELGNAFEEEFDPEENRRRFKECQRQRTEQGIEVADEDEDFYTDLSRGVSPACGIAIGFDRLLALLTGENAIKEIMPF